MTSPESELQAQHVKDAAASASQPPHAGDSRQSANSLSVQRRRRPRRLLRYFLIQLLPVTAGILIALLIDGLIELRRERVLVEEAHAAIAAEIASNQLDLQETMPSLNRLSESLIKTVTEIDNLVATGTTDVSDISLGMSNPSLNKASWETAQRTGSLSYMNYAAVKEYSELYALQDIVITSQNRMLEYFSDMGALYHAMESEDPVAHPEDLQSSRAAILRWTMAIGVHRGLAEQLATSYEEMPGKLAAIKQGNQQQ